MKTWPWVLGIITLTIVVLCIAATTRSAFTIVNKGRGTKKSLYKTKNGAYVKKWDRKYSHKYFLEKKFYTRLKKSDHIPDLISYDDDRLELEIEDAGTPLKEYSESQLKEIEKQIPDWKDQIKMIISLFNENDLTYTDWHKGNILYKDKLLKVIDFDTDSNWSGLSPQLPLDNHDSLKSYLTCISSRYGIKKKNRNSSTPRREPSAG